MKQMGRDILISLLMGLVLPGMMLNFAVALWNRETEQTPAVVHAPQEEAVTVALTVKVRTDDGRIEEWDMDTYLVGVVLAEMPAQFESEALKAQSVAARTYARKAGITGGKHGDGSVCTQPSCCQAYRSEGAYLDGGGTMENVEKVRSAVLSTSGQVMTYDGQLIEATYFSCSGGSTEDAAAVWGSDFPYLQAVESPGEENAAYFRDAVIFSKRELEKKLNVSLTGKAESWTGPVTYTDGGGVSSIAIGGTFFAGTEIRTLLGLRSAAFETVPRENALEFITKGYGHRVGMSQYGADAMAVAGSSYEQILTHYYQGAELTRLSED